MAILLIIVGVILVYVSTGIMVLDFLKQNKKKLKYYDYILAFVPVVRVLRMLLEVEE